VPNEGRLAVPARRDEEDLLAGRQIGDEAVELDDAIDERGGRDDLAVDKRVVRYGDRRNSYVISRNGGMSNNPAR
jgi:hypothetical protein